MEKVSKPTIDDIPLLVDKIPIEYRDQVADMSAQIISHPAYGTK